jgi:hypothetical protein
MVFSIVLQNASVQLRKVKLVERLFVMIERLSRQLQESLHVLKSVNSATIVIGNLDLLRDSCNDIPAMRMRRSDDFHEGIARFFGSVYRISDKVGAPLKVGKFGGE